MVLHVSRIRSTSIPPENPLYRGMLRRSRCVLIFSLKYPCMTINDILQYTSVHSTIYPSQGPIPVCLDGTIIDSSTILVNMYYCGYVGV